MKAGILAGLAILAWACAAARAQTPPAQGGAQPEAPPAVRPSPAPASAGTVIHYHIYQAGAAHLPNSALEANGPRRELLCGPLFGCNTCGSTTGVAAPRGCGVAGKSTGSFFQNPCGYFKQKCNEMKDACDARSCSHGKTLGDFGCGSCRLDCLFMFGSCHDFFEEPCRRVQPPPAYRRW